MQYHKIDMNKPLACAYHIILLLSVDVCRLLIVRRVMMKQYSKLEGTKVVQNIYIFTLFYTFLITLLKLSIDRK